jgi:hypothetical protein
VGDGNLARKLSSDAIDYTLEIAQDLTNYGSALSFRQRAGGRLSGCAAYHPLLDAGHTAMLHDEP